MSEVLDQKVDKARPVPERGSPSFPSEAEIRVTLGEKTEGPKGICYLENNPEIPPSSRDEGLRLLHGLETNLAASLQTPQEA